MGGLKEGVKRSSGLISRIPGMDRVAVKVSVVQVKKVKDKGKYQLNYSTERHKLLP